MATIVTGGTEQSNLVTVVVDSQNLGIFDTYSGGDSLAKEASHRPGGQGDQVGYATLAVYSNLKVQRVLQHDRDFPLVKSLKPLSGRVEGSVTIQPIDADGNAYGPSETASGMFLGVSGIKGDSNSEAIQMFDLDFSVLHWA